MNKILHEVLMLVLLLGGSINLNAENKWVKTNLSDLKSNDQVVIVDLTSKTAMSNDKGTSKAPTAVAVTLNSDNSELTSTVDDNLKWTVTVSDATYKFGVGKNYLYCINDNNGVRVGDNKNNTFTAYSSGNYSGLTITVSSTKKGKTITTKRYIGVYNSQDWRCYTSTTGNIASTSIAYYKLTNVEPGKTTTSLSFAEGNKTFLQGQTDGVEFTNAATLTPTVDGATISYTSSNENLAVVDENGKVRVVTDNAGTATITAKFAGNNSYTEASTSYTITVEKVFQNIAELKAAYSSSDITVALKLTDAQVTYVDGKAHYLQDATGAVNLYGSDFDYAAGDKLNGYATVTYTLYNGLPEISKFEALGQLTKTSGDAPAPTEMTITDAQKEENLCKYIVVKNVTVAPGTKTGNATATDKGGNSINVYKSNQSYVEGQYDLTGIASIYRSDKQIAFISYAPDFEIDEDADANAITAGENGTVTFSRTFNSNAWNSLVLPFALTADQLTAAFGSNAKFAKYTGTTEQSDGTYTLNFETVTSTEANVPVFVWGATDAVYTAEGVTVVKADATSTPSGASYSFTGSYDKTTAKESDWFIASDNKFYEAAGTESVKPTRAVFRAVATTTQAKSLSFAIDGTTTAINAINGNSIVLDSKAPMYNLSGQRVNSSYKGVVIQNGKKFIK
jgi:hypothetical protein